MLCSCISTSELAVRHRESIKTLRLQASRYLGVNAFINAFSAAAVSLHYFCVLQCSHHIALPTASKWHMILDRRARKRLERGAKSPSLILLPSRIETRLVRAYDQRSSSIRVSYATYFTDGLKLPVGHTFKLLQSCAACEQVFPIALSQSFNPAHDSISLNVSQIDCLSTTSMQSSEHTDSHCYLGDPDSEVGLADRREQEDYGMQHYIAAIRMFEINPVKLSSQPSRTKMIPTRSRNYHSLHELDTRD